MVFVFPGNLYAQEIIDPIENDNNNKNKNKDWGFKISPYAWLAGQATDVEGEKIRQSFQDLTSLTNFGFQLAASVRYKRFVLSSDGTIAQLGTNITEGPLRVKMNINQIILDTKIGYLIFSDIDYGKVNEVIRGWSIEGNIGAKYWKNDVTVDYAIYFGDTEIDSGSFTEPQEWTDLMIGIRSKIYLNKRVLLGIAGDIGGFGIGNASKFSWDFTFVNTFKVLDFLDVTAGYRTFKYRRVDGEGDTEIETKVTAFGPMLGVSFVF